MAKSKISLSDKRLNEKVTAVWLIQGGKRFLLNYFKSFGLARNYERCFRHMKINGEILLGEISLIDLISQ